MSEMVERIAVALLAEDDEVGAFNARVLAKAAIEAMREPTNKMIVAGGTGGTGDCIAIYQEMIDAALKD